MDDALFYSSHTENGWISYHLRTWATYYIKPMRRNAYTRNGCANGMVVITRLVWKYGTSATLEHQSFTRLHCVTSQKRILNFFSLQNIILGVAASKKYNFKVWYSCCASTIHNKRFSFIKNTILTNTSRPTENQESFKECGSCCCEYYLAYSVSNNPIIL